ncbi:MAG: serine/threonine protein kinase, partial [Planctomycetes bacterium]|nr:serine/threonine protein kinase [Planctomycetota bacterium]
MEELFEIVAATASAQRAARFEALCGAYPEHAARLRDLRGRVLAFDELIDGVATEVAADGDPAQIGPYRIVERLGEGGFGVVYRALQEEPLKREVALKLGREARASRAFLRRFELEREALAALDHPHVARILDAGRAIDGRPWFALEYIAGVPIDVYCEREALDLRARVELFRQVCEGLHHAHLRGILHRDLKPSNLLVATVVEPDGRKRAVAKVIDFGIARRLDEAGALSTAERTLEGQIVGTPEYLSPEQASLDPRAIDARSDVYGLGLVLQKLLVGALPFGRPAATPTGLHEHLRRVANEEPPAPRACFLRALERGEAPSAARENPRSWERALGSDLGWVLQRALACAKERRYQSVAALDEELARWLEHRAVLAGPPSVLYRASRFARRYRLQLGAALAVALALIAGTIVSLLYAREASESAAHSQQSELAAKRSESAARRSEQEAQQSRAAAQENLDRFLRMADGVVLDELEREARDALGAPRPENLEAMQGWIARAEALASRLVGHREMHALLRERAVAESGASGVEEPRLREPADQLLFEGLAKLVQRLELFAGASG